MSTAPVTELAAIPRDEGTAVQRIVEQKQMIAECMQQVMKPDEHYGIIPGTSRKDPKTGREMAKPTLLKAGAETLGVLFRLRPSFKILSAVETPEFIKYRVKCTLRHIETGNVWGEGLGSCNSREAKYVRPAPKKCPKCGSEALIFGKEEFEKDPAFKGGMFCYGKKGGCGQKFKPGDEAIEKQPTGVADPSDLDNTILKMACKRAHVHATLTATAASDFFTQDLEDLTEKAAEYTPPPAPPAPSPAPASKLANEARALDHQAKEVAADAGPKAATTAGASTAAQPTSATAPAATPPTGPTTSKPPTANKVAWEFPKCSPEQVKLIHVLRGKFGGKFAGPDHDARSAWRKALGAYKDADGKPITTSPDLSKGQATHLIDRMKAAAAKQEETHAKLEAEAPENVAALGGVSPAMSIIERDKALNDVFKTDAEESDWLVATFDVPERHLLTPEQTAKVIPTLRLQQLLVEAGQ